MNYCIIVHIHIPKYLQNRLQRLQNCAAEYVLRKYANTSDVINLNWLPVAENTEFNVSKLAYQGLHDKNWSEYLPIKLIKRRRNLRSNNSGRLNTVKRMLSSKRLMNSLIRYQLILECDKKSFISKARSLCKDKAWLGYCPHKVFSIFLFIWSI